MHKGDVLKVNYYSRLMHWYRWQEFKLPFFNDIARTAMWAKNFNDQRKTIKNTVVSDQELEDFFETQKIFFGFCTFRSGSTFLTDLLARELKNSQILHEPNINDYWSYPKVLKSENNADHYVQTYRKKDIYQRISKQNFSIYGEMNPFFVLHCQAVKKLLPSAFIFHLVRDGRDVVRSNYSREVLGRKDPMLKLIQPPKDDPFRKDWGNFNRFEKICWKWQYENKLLRETTLHSVQFEKMISDYRYFDEKINQPLAINIPLENWKLRSSMPKHATPKYTLPPWPKWTDRHKDSFEKICGDEMVRCGYSLNWETAAKKIPANSSNKILANS